jgi:hypothetical protein
MTDDRRKLERRCVGQFDFVTYFRQNLSAWKLKNQPANIGSYVSFG